MRISVITVCYNSVRSIRRCIDSVVNQTFLNVEHIIIDGGSTDGTMDVLSEFSEHISFLASEPDSGIYNAMNKGLHHVTGDVVCFLNSDDWYKDEHVLEDVVNLFLREQCEVVFGGVSFISSRVRDKVVRAYPAKGFRPDNLRRGWMPPHPGVFCKKFIFDEIGWFNEDYKIAGDFDFILRLFLDRDVKYRVLDQAVVLMSLGGVSTSGLRSSILLNREIAKSCRDNGLKSNIFLLLSRYPLKYLIGKFRS